MKEAILNKGTASDAIPNVNVVTWPGAFRQLLSNATAEVAYAGRVLGKQLYDLGAGALKDIQFIGHSLGTLVNAYAADYLIKRGITIDQFTILDRPFGNSGAGLIPGGAIDVGISNLDQKIFQQLLPKDKVTWVDNYFGTGTTAAGAAFMGDTKAQNVTLAGLGHSDVHHWYQCTISKTAECIAEYSASIMVDGIPLAGLGLDGGYLYSTTLGRGHPTPQWDPGTFKEVTNAINLTPNAWLTHNCAFSAVNFLVQCHEGSPAFLWSNDFTIPTNAQYVAFDFKWLNKGDGDSLSLQFGNNLLFNFRGDGFEGEDFMSSGLIPIEFLKGMTDQLAFALNSVGESNAQFEIANLHFVSFDSTVPEPSTLSLFALTLLCLGAMRRRRLH